MHPLNSNDFGANGIIVNYTANGVTTVTGHIVKQLSTNRFVVTSGSVTNTSSYVTITLATTLAQVSNLATNATSLTTSLGTIEVTNYNNTIEHAFNIQSNKLQTIEGHTYAWHRTATTTPGTCTINGNWITGPDKSGFTKKINT